MSAPSQFLNVAGLEQILESIFGTINGHTNTLTNAISALAFIKNLNYNDQTGVLTWTFRNDATGSVNIINETLLKDIDYNHTTRVLTLTKANGETITTNLADLIDIYVGATPVAGDTIQISVSSGNEISGMVLAGSIGMDRLTTALQAIINGKADTSTVNSALAGQQEQIDTLNNTVQSIVTSGSTPTNITSPQGTIQVGQVDNAFHRTIDLSTAAQTSLSKADTAAQPEDLPVSLSKSAINDVLARIGFPEIA
jgi:hypothetical protein